jgi:hypothetical protein
VCGMNDPADLREALSRLARSSPRSAGASTELRVLTAFRAQRRRSQLRRAWWIGAAACLALSAGSFWVGRATRAPHLLPVTAPVALGGSMEGFVALPYGQSDVPLEQAIVVRVHVGRSELGRLGLVTVPAGKDEARGAKDQKIDADLLVGQDGMARAVRLVDLKRP